MTGFVLKLILNGINKFENVFKSRLILLLQLLVMFYLLNLDLYVEYNLRTVNCVIFIISIHLLWWWTKKVTTANTFQSLNF